jgi:prepilin-type processing-associated H-X9-DG protein
VIAGKKSYVQSEGILGNYVSKGIEKCPSFADYTKDGAFDQGAGGYGLIGGGSLGEYSNNSSYLPVPAKISQVKKPSSSAMVGDTAISPTYSPSDSVIEYPTMCTPVFSNYPQWGISATTPSTHFRHNERANIVFADGHTKDCQAFTYKKRSEGTNADTFKFNGNDYTSNRTGFIDPELYFIRE